MTSFLGPDNPPPLSLISEISQRSLQVSRICHDDDDMFDFGEEYYYRMCKLLRLQSGINIDDRICVVCSRRSRVATEIERRLSLIYPILKLSFGRALYEEVSEDRDIPVGMLHIDAEEYFKNDHPLIKFDKVIIFDGLEMIDDRKTFLDNVRETLVDGVDSSLVLIHRTREMVTLPVFLEAMCEFGRRQIEIEELLVDLISSGFLVGWNIVALPIHIAKKRYLNQLYNHFPPLMEDINLTDIFGGLRELVDTSFKYSEYRVVLKDRFLLLVASSSLSVDHQPYKMHLLDDEIETMSDQTPPFVANRLLRLNITSDIKCFLPKNLDTMSRFIEDEDEYPEEWWGTMVDVPSVGLDKSRVNRFVPRRHRK